MKEFKDTLRKDGAILRVEQRSLPCLPAGRELVEKRREPFA